MEKVYEYAAAVLVHVKSYNICRKHVRCKLYTVIQKSHDARKGDGKCCLSHTRHILNQNMPDVYKRQLQPSLASTRRATDNAVISGSSKTSRTPVTYRNIRLNSTTTANKNASI